MPKRTSSQELVGSKAIRAYLKERHYVVIGRVTLWNWMNAKRDPFPADNRFKARCARLYTTTKRVDAWVAKSDRIVREEPPSDED